MSHKLCIPSIIKKFLMALTGFIFVVFVFAHMAGNLQMFISPDAINEYAHLLQTLPYKLLWISRIVLLTALVIHVWMAILLTRENKAAAPQKYLVSKRIQASLASKTMGVSGSILLFFIVFHILHYTTRWIFPVYQSNAFYTMLNGEMVYNVYKMMVVGFSKIWVSVLYIVAMAFLCMHLSHGVTSMFQSMGWRNEKWRYRLDSFAVCYAWVIFLGFIAIPVAVLLSIYANVPIFPDAQAILSSMNLSQ